MIRHSFNDNWYVVPKESYFSGVLGTSEQPKEVTLPHDAMIEQKRRSNTASGSATGYFPDGVYKYSKKFIVPPEYKNKRITIEFEGVYTNARVYINGDFAGQCPYGYSNFYVKADQFLKYGAENEIEVVAGTYNDSRWYSGAGIYRNTKIMVANLVHILFDGVKISTTDIDSNRAVVTLSTVIENEGFHPQATNVLTEIIDAEGNVVASDKAPITLFAGKKEILRQRVYVKQPILWSVEQPYLYRCKTTVIAGEEVLDEELTTFGIRSLTIDPDKGLCINGETVKLRGACIHHDNGVIGAASIDRAVERRVEILKEAGFNAIRSAHHPISKAFLDACDRQGMLVMDEAFDMWTNSKSYYDYSLNFPTWWEQDVQAMVDKNYNHPSVILYSLGNEIPESGSAMGASWGRKIAEKVRSIDNTRFVMISTNGLHSVMDKLLKMKPGRPFE
ncbi:glycoside hydrolase family 2 TIM barrel-domain containing protein [Paenibacillus sp. D2_2]|uniref:glycoside hydrolase family 2 protein n=1 Tax=Paenibacillus sp. D2_2 TaxID=3073092 RepID=UPI002814A93F|nr:glycoside hydrolase family 2 TIM barrel-domain containing protein [Paenibacillus sp. D2_2]WMT41324.1 glycoside hydrolase family 2 TIM barrel-domain containing protein [Paenibacillus sp. D2_2]